MDERPAEDLREAGQDVHGGDTATTTHATTGQHEGGGMPQLNVETFAGQLFWLTLTFVLLYLLVAKSAVPKIEGAIGRRADRIASDLDQAETMSEQADAAKASVEKFDADTRAESGRIVAEGLAAQKQAEADQLSALDRTLNSEMAAADARLKEQENAMQAQIAPLAEQATAQIVEKILGRAPGNSARKAS